MKPKCQNCTHMVKPRSKLLELGFIKGQCRRFPPIPVAMVYEGVTEVEAVWPKVKDNDYCGEFDGWRYETDDNTTEPAPSPDASCNPSE